MKFFSRFDRLPSQSSKRSARRPLVRRRLQAESLEQRTLMSVNPGGGDDTTTGGGGSLISPDLNHIPPRLYSANVDTGKLTGPSSDTPLNIAKAYLTAHAGEFGISATDIATMKVTDEYSSSQSGVTHLYFQQSRDGLEILHSRINVNISPRGEVISVGENFVAGLNGTPAVNPAISATDAVQAAARAVGITSTVQTNVLTLTTAAARETTIEASTFSEDIIPAKLVYAPTKAGGVKLAWQVVARTPDGEHWYNLAVDAADGKLISKVDWVSHFSDDHSHDADGYDVENNLTANALTVPPAPNPLVTPGTYNVYPLPVRGVGDGSRSIVTTAGDPLASPYGWHDTNGAPGAEFADTRGNNVHVQVDEDDDEGDFTDGFRPNGGPLHTFDFPIDLTQNPGTYRAAATTNLFYWNNVIHDILHHYGFDEASGNFQQTNYSGAGSGGDPVQADAQDSIALTPIPSINRNNANFATPPDGMSPRMQMYVFEPYADGIIRDGALNSEIVVHEFGHGLNSRLTGGPANADALMAAESQGMDEGWADYLALVLTQQPSDTKMGSRALTNDLLGPFGGLRRTPYSYDMSVNPRLMSDFNYSGSRHDNGEVWAATLWDMTWLMIDKYGYDSDLYYGSGGNNGALELVVQGMKLQPANPTYLAARDAILLADFQLNFGVNQDTIWEAFSRRGMGRDADPGANADDVVRDGFLRPSAAYNDVLTTEVGLPVSMNLLTNDYDADSINPASVVITAQPQFGSISVDPVTGQVTYLTTNPAAVTDLFSYTYTDARGNVSNVANVRVDVVTPQISIADVTLAEGNSGGTPFGFTVTIDPPSLRPITINYQVNSGTATRGQDFVPSDFGQLTIAPGQSTASLDVFVMGDSTRELAETFTVLLSNPTSGVIVDGLAIGTITDDETLVAPVATADVFTVNEDTLGVIDVLANDSDADGSLNRQSVTITVPPVNGTATINPSTGAISYRSNANYSGSDSLQYTVRDLDGMTSSAVGVSITVTPVNDAPVAVDDMIGTEIGVPALINVVANDTDAEDSALLGSNVTISQQPIGGTATITPEGMILFTPDAGFSGATIIQYTVRDGNGLSSNTGRVMVRVGDAVQMSGFVFVDANNNGVMDSSEHGISGVSVAASMTLGGMTVRQIAVTDADGAYTIAESAGVVLPAGTYELSEAHPAFFVDGKDTYAGSQSAANDKFMNLAIAAGESLSGVNFGELGVKPEFASAYAGRRAFFASTTPGADDLNLAGGDVWYSFDGGFSGLLNAAASFPSGQGTTTLTLLNSSMTALATATGTDYAKLSYQGSPGQSYLLKVSGNNSAVDLRTYFGETWQNVFNHLDANNDRSVTPLDALVIINSLNARTNARLTSADLSSGAFLDVTGDKSLTPLDVLQVINHLNARPAASAMTESSAPAAATSLTANGLIAQGLAVDAAIEGWDLDGSPVGDQSIGAVSQSKSTTLVADADGGNDCAAEGLANGLPRRRAEASEVAE